MAREIPSLEAIEAFLEVAETGGVRAASDRLALSPSATSRRIASLEGFLGTVLFDRAENRLHLTIAGHRYRDAVAPALQAIGRASTMVDKDSNRIVIATSNSLALRWLMPRMGRLQQEAGLTLDIIPSRDANVLRSGEAQFGLWGSTLAPDLMCEKLFDVHAFPVASPSRIDSANSHSFQAICRDLPLLAPKEPARIWQRWLSIAGMAEDGVQIIECANLALTYEAAVAGVGIALAIPLLCEHQLSSGTLVQCGASYPTGENYALYSARRRKGRSQYETQFLHWLRREIRLSIESFTQRVTA